MGRFFGNVKEEKKEMKRRICGEEKEEQNRNINKKEKQREEILNKISDLENERNQKQFDKSLKKLLGEIKKTQIILTEEIINFLKSEKVYCKGFRSLVDEIVEKYEEKEEVDEVEVDKKSNKKDWEKQLEEVLLIKDMKTRKEKLLKLKETSPDSSQRVNLLTILLSMKIRMKEENALEILEEILLKEKHHLNNLDFFLREINSTLKEEEYGRFEILLNKVEVGEIRKLEFYYFKKKEELETENQYFRILYHTRKGDREKAIEEFDKVEFNEADRIHLDILTEFGKACIKWEEYEKAFKALSKTGLEENKTSIFFLCILLNHKVKNSGAFKAFLEEFKNFSENKFLSNNYSDLMTSFFYLNMLRVDRCFELLRKLVPEFKKKRILEEYAMDLIKHN